MDTEEIILSVIIPVYNASKYLVASVESVLNQNFSHLEIILVDDGSTDGSENICDLFAQNDRRVKVIHKENEGVSSARNIGLAKSVGEYIGFVDSDDLIEPDMYEVMVSLARENDADIVQCEHNRNVSFDNIVKRDLSDVKIISGMDLIRIMLFEAKGGRYTNIVSLQSKIFRRKVITGLIFPFGRTYEDDAETYKTFLKANKIVIINQEFYHYVKRDNSIITGKSGIKIIDKALALEDRMNYLQSINYDFYAHAVVLLYNYLTSSYVLLAKDNNKPSDLEKTKNILFEKMKTNRKKFSKHIGIYNRINLLMFIVGGEKTKTKIADNEFSLIQNVLSKIKSAFIRKGENDDN